jgi:hypothetical protein
MPDLGDLSNFIENKQELVNHDWLNLTPGVDYDNIPTDNVAEKIPELANAWSVDESYPHKRLDYQVPEAAIGDAKAEIPAGLIEDVVMVAKRAMMQGLEGKELSSHIKQRFPEEQIKAASEELKKVASEKGLLGNVYIDLSCFDTSKQASAILGQNKIRLAYCAVGSPKKEQDFVDSYGNVRGLGKKATQKMEWTPELFSFYQNHLRTAGMIAPDAVIASKEDLQNAFLFPLRKEAKSSERQGFTTEVKDLSEDEVKSRLEEMSKTKKEANAALSKEASTILSFMQNEMLKGKLGDGIKEAVSSKFASDVIAKNASSIKRVAGNQGLQGAFYVDVSLYSSAKEATDAIKKAKTSPRYLVQTGDHGDRISLVASATGLKPLPTTGDISRQEVSSIIASLLNEDRISSKQAAVLNEKLAQNTPALQVVKQAYLSTASYKPEQRVGGVQASIALPKEQTPELDFEVVKKSIKTAFDKGLGYDLIEGKTASMVPAVQAHSMVKEVLSSLDRVPAESLTKCATERYPLKKGAKIACATKCGGCVHAASGFCTKQASSFVGTKTAFDLNLSTSSNSKTASSLNDEFQMNDTSLEVDFSGVVEPPKTPVGDSLDFGIGMDAHLS